MWTFPISIITVFIITICEGIINIAFIIARLIVRFSIWYLIDTGRKLNVYKTCVRSIYVLCLRVILPSSFFFSLMVSSSFARETAQKMKFSMKDFFGKCDQNPSVVPAFLFNRFIIVCSIVKSDQGLPKMDFFAKQQTTFFTELLMQARIHDLQI